MQIMHFQGEPVKRGVRLSPPSAVGNRVTGQREGK